MPPSIGFYLLSILSVCTYTYGPFIIQETAMAVQNPFMVGVRWCEHRHGLVDAGRFILNVLGSAYFRR